MKKSESLLVKKIMDYLRTLRYVRAHRVPGNIYSAGQADITGSYAGLRFDLEVKVAPNKLTPRQESNLSAWLAVGSMAAVVYSVDDVKAIMKLMYNMAVSLGLVDLVAADGGEAIHYDA